MILFIFRCLTSGCRLTRERGLTTEIGTTEVGTTEVGLIRKKVGLTREMTPEIKSQFFLKLRNCRRL